MKTTKILMVIVLFSIATLGFSQSEYKKEPLSVKISLKNAVKNPGLVAAMYQQLDPGFLKVEARLYTVNVKYKKTTYSIYGSSSEWKFFFLRGLRDLAAPDNQPPDM